MVLTLFSESPLYLFILSAKTRTFRQVCTPFVQKLDFDIIAGQLVEWDTDMCTSCLLHCKMLEFVHFLYRSLSLKLMKLIADLFKIIKAIIRYVNTCTHSFTLSREACKYDQEITDHITTTRKRY